MCQEVLVATLYNKTACFCIVMVEDFKQTEKFSFAQALEYSTLLKGLFK